MQALQEGPPSKKAMTTKRRRKLPDNATVMCIPGDAACLFHAINQAVAHLHNKPLWRVEEMRAKVVAHVGKRADEYCRHWDGMDSEDKPCPSFQAYVDHMHGEKTYGGELEVFAAARKFKHCIVVVPGDSAYPVGTFNNVPSAKGTIVLWYTGNHYTWVKMAGELPQEWSSCKRALERPHVARWRDG